MTYSARYGYTVPKTLNVQEIKESLKNGVVDAIEEVFLSNISSNFGTEKTYNFDSLCTILWHHLFFEPLRKIPFKPDLAKNFMIMRIETAGFPKFYDYIEFLANISKHEALAGGFNIEKYTNWCYKVFEREHAPIRFVSGVLVELTNANEIREIEIAADSHIDTVSTHIQSAIVKFSDRLTPDYRNSVKESISAVEAASRVVSGNTNATLGDALSAIEKSGQLHGSLKKGFSAIYGWTSDTGGVRHALSDKETITEADARFMLVACSAFANYLLAQIRPNDDIN